jgi:hypothetical protein
LVCGPTSPSTAIAVADWKVRTAWSVAGPKSPSTTRPAPCLLSRLCSSVTQPLYWPCWITDGQDEENRLIGVGAASAGLATASATASAAAITPPTTASRIRPRLTGIPVPTLVMKHPLHMRSAIH